MGTTADFTRKLRPGRYMLATALVSAWIMIGSLHLPVDTWLPAACEIVLYPSFRLFLPWTLFQMAVLPWDASGFGVRDVLALCAMDLMIGAVICLPLLFPSGRKQHIAAIASLFLAIAYTLWAILFHFKIAEWMGM